MVIDSLFQKGSQNLQIMFSTIYLRLEGNVTPPLLIFNFKWNFGRILGQHDILVLGDVPVSPESGKFFFYRKLDLSWPMYPPTPRIEKKIFKK